MAQTTLGLTQNELARILNMASRHLRSIISGKNPAGYWLTEKIQKLLDEQKAEITQVRDDYQRSVIIELPATQESFEKLNINPKRSLSWYRQILARAWHEHGVQVHLEGDNDDTWNNPPYGTC